MSEAPAAPKTAPGMPSLDEILIQSRDIPWREKSLKGISENAANQFMYCLEGRYEYTSSGVVLTPGCFYCNPKGNVHGPAIAHEDTVVVEIYDGPHYPQRPPWYDNDEDAR